ncbi:MAG: hypothetical protein ACLRZG_06940 [Streptococcus sp.]
MSVAIIKAMNGQINDLNETQLRKGSGVVAKWLERMRSNLTEDQTKALREEYDKGTINKAEYNQKMEELSAQHQSKMWKHLAVSMLLFKRNLAKSPS